MALVLLDLVVVAAAVAVWTGQRSQDRRGSAPPPAQVMPDLGHVRGIVPPLPKPRELRGEAVLLVVTCVQCQSADLVGGFLERLGGALPDRSAVHVLGLEGNVRKWGRRHHLGSDLTLHAVGAGAADETRSRLRVGGSPVAFVYDLDGRWVSTFHLGQLDRDDVIADLESAADGRLE